MERFGSLCGPQLALSVIGTPAQSHKPQTAKQCGRLLGPTTNNSRTMSSSQASTKPTAAGSDLAQAAAGLLCVRTSSYCRTAQSDEHVNCKSSACAFESQPSAISRSVPVRKPDPLIANIPTTSAASLAVGLRSLQAVESLLKGYYMKSVPPIPDGGMTADQEKAWKRARSRVYTQRNRAKTSEQVELLERGIVFFKRQLGIQHHTNKPDSNKETSKLKGVKRNVYLPPKEQLDRMTNDEVTEWKRKERLRRKREANAATAQQQQEQIMRLAIEHETLHDQYRVRCRETGTVEQDWFEQTMTS